MKIYDIVFLTEIKTSLKISSTGFKVYQNSAKKGHRGGIALLIKPFYVQFLKNLDRSYENVISFELEFLPDIVFLGIYITPKDSPYYDGAIFGYIQSVLKKDTSKIVYVIGDLNSRVGNPVDLYFEDNLLEYDDCDDLAVNENGKCLLDMCRGNNVAVVNNLKYGDKHFKTQLSFRKKNRWISEPDILVTSRSGVDLIDTFETIQYYDGKHLYSDHALLHLVIDLEKVKISTSLLKQRADYLGASVYDSNPIQIQKSLRVAQCNKDAIISYFDETEPPNLIGNETIDDVVNEFTTNIIKVIKDNKLVRRMEPEQWGNQAKWTRLLKNNDLRTIWKAIGWNGELSESNETSVPSDEEFKMHFEKLLNPEELEETELIHANDSPYIPILDDQITVNEVIETVSEMKENKSYIGFTPGIFCCLSPAWIIFVTQLLNLIFTDNSLKYPVKWCYSKLVVLFKKGARLVCGNYRGLSIGETFGKLYCTILCKRLKQWMHIDECQAGAQEGRGCTEHILALRLLIDFARSQKCKLFILFVDFSKAYDNVPRNTLFTILKNLGCGQRFLSALMAVYRNTINILNSEYIRATIGVKQGGPMSCILFVIYLNVMVLMIKLLDDDSFLGNQHLMVLMDDTVLLGTTREKIKQKFSILIDFCEQYGMKVNELKTRLLVINGNKSDRGVFTYKNVTVKHDDTYIYLGSPFIENGSMKSVVTLHLKSRISDINKYKIFCKTNSTMPYIYKRKVLVAAIVSSLLYGCESWFLNDFKEVKKKYIEALKALLGVRVTTRYDIILLETGMPTLKELICDRTVKFVRKNVRGDLETPLSKAYKICQNNNTKGYSYLKSLLDNPNNETIDNLRIEFINVQGTRADTYRSINPNLEVHRVYTSTSYIEEHKRISFTRFRLSSHHLKVETGRWSRTPIDGRLCECGVVQDEDHVVFVCYKTNDLREKYRISRRVYKDVGELMEICDEVKLVNFIHEVMVIFDV